jgi:hypothetical protein
VPSSLESAGFFAPSAGFEDDSIGVDMILDASLSVGNTPNDDAMIQTNYTVRLTTEA